MLQLFGYTFLYTAPISFWLNFLQTFFLVIILVFNPFHCARFRDVWVSSLAIRLALSCDKSAGNIERDPGLISRHFIKIDLSVRFEPISFANLWIDSTARPTFRRITNLGQMDPSRNNFWGWHWGSAKFLEAFIRLNDITKNGMLASVTWTDLVHSVLLSYCYYYQFNLSFTYEII